MKFILTISILFFTSIIFGQSNKTGEPAFFFDSKLVSTFTIQSVDPDDLKSVNVIKKDTTINDITYRGQIHIISKNPATHDLINLEQIKSDFTKVKSSDVIYMVNGELIKDNAGTFKLDRNYILKVEVTNSDELYNFRKNDTKFDIINILGKNIENLENTNKILLRGHEAIGVK